ncbi:2-phospho-L-lactate guanylyltransferase [Trujillonella endophytica]|uniref:Phosphoenolpyruvate guanylyltransferase n=1 Tax=Trujillonella endophytica TaxID=673521 RepID=A0A1H8QQZ4_9ACTN|nr:2-phospho-L-lactate guanylyltransferase [Trujillella endophytica]SEO56639.1 2-phospho-L-lactate guanylyltransferase [Trujillella endophytica]
MSRAPGWSVVIPLKPLDQAKSRLRLPVPLRRELTIAMARDVLDAVLTCDEVRHVLVLTRDRRWLAHLDPPGCDFLADDPADSLNDALRRGASACLAKRPGACVAALTGDVPALRPGELQRALDCARTWETSFVPDASGKGTTLFAARAGVPFAPHYGCNSRARHVLEGAHEILLPRLGGLRQDVDTPADIERARALGLGAHTTALLEEVTGDLQLPITQTLP